MWLSGVQQPEKDLKQKVAGAGSCILLTSMETMRREDMVGYHSIPTALPECPVQVCLWTHTYQVASPKSVLEMYNLRHQPSPIKSKYGVKISLNNTYTRQSLGSSGYRILSKYSHSFSRHLLSISSVPSTPLGAEEPRMDKSQSGPLRSLWGTANPVH